MIHIGRTNELQVRERSPHGLYLTDGQINVLLPNRYIPADARPGDTLKVFVTNDSEDRPVATTQKPRGEVGDFFAGRVREITTVGAFVDWGLDKDLLIPFREQRVPLRAGQMGVFRILLDSKTNRVIGSTRLPRLDPAESRGFREGQRINGLIADIAPDGARVVVENRGTAMIFPDELLEDLRVGDRRPMFVKRVREDGALALSLAPSGFAAAQDLGPQILEKLSRSGGFLPLSDSAKPEDIREAFGVSKSTFKKAIGNLQKQGLITIEHFGIRLKS